MLHGTSITDRISTEYGGLSTKLREAADYVEANPLDVATRSLRSVAETSGVSPATFSRLARALGYSDYEELREAGRAAVGRKITPFSQRAQSLRSGGQRDLLNEQAQACITNIAYLDQNVPRDRLSATVDTLLNAQNVLLFGAMGSSGLVDYFAYQAQWFTANWHVADRTTTPASALSRMEPGDVVFVLSKAPYAMRAIRVLEQARAQNLTTIVVTDSHSFPAMEFADFNFIVPTESANFFSSYGATVVLLESIISELLTKTGVDAEDRIRRVEDQARALGDSWAT